VDNAVAYYTHRDYAAKLWHHSGEKVAPGLGGYIGEGGDVDLQRRRSTTSSPWGVYLRRPWGASSGSGEEVEADEAACGGREGVNEEGHK
jgi:hypothetical protein